MRYANVEVDGELVAAEVRGEAVAPLEGVGPITAGFDLEGLAGASRRRESKGLALLAFGRYLEDKACFVIQANSRQGRGPGLLARLE